MRSDTALTLAEFGRWLGANPWQLAQIDYGEQKIAGASCDGDCTYQYMWQDGVNSRETLIDAIRAAEFLFRFWTSRYPCPTAIVDDEIDFPFPERGFYDAEGKLKVFRPHWHNVIEFGTVSLTQIADDEPLDRDAPDPPADVFYITGLAVPDDTEADDVIVALTPADGGYTDGAEPELQYQIRPLTVTIDSSGGAGNWTADIEGDAYLFVLPSLYEAVEPVCQEHLLATYVEEVDVWVKSVDTTDHGHYVLNQTDCGDDLCTESTQTFCIERKAIGMYAGRPADYDGGWSRVCLQFVPQFINLNYVAGEPMSYGGFLDKFVVQILSLITVGIMAVDWELCCNACFTEKFMFYNRAQKEIVTGMTHASTSIRGAEQYQLLKSAPFLDQWGYDPTRGLIKAYFDLKQSGWISPSGVSV